MKVESMRWRFDLCVVCVVSPKDRCRNSNVRERCDFKEDVVTRVATRMSPWFDHLEKTNESRLTKQIYRTNSCSGKVDKSSRRKSFTDHIGGISKKGQILSTRNRRPCM
ncbi:hypothetical protein EVAR_56249_1 [Eumeta japonica]|uniref:Uncharacterized protein n=1 Tax=Eumeta variegata TaxID=151549 RepID=A0A4C1XFM1_EUMVA|nr:hypothetical protein EVAR_56249_1 [Eumeta japonica]